MDRETQAGELREAEIFCASGKRSAWQAHSGREPMHQARPVNQAAYLTFIKD
jgi:hypothetical protein